MNQIAVRTEMRRRFTRIGWAFLLYIFIAQFGSAFVFLLLPARLDTTASEYVFYYAIIYLVAPFFLWLMVRKMPSAPGPHLRITPAAFARTVLFCMGVLFLFSYLTDWCINLLEVISGIPTADILQDIKDLPLWADFVLTCIAAPIFEELIFRRILLEPMRPFGTRAAILVSGIAFGLFHCNLYQFFYASVLGMIFAGIVLKTGKLWHSMLLHACVNFLSGLLSEGYDAIPFEADWIDYSYLAVVFLAIAAAVYIFVRYFRTYRFEPASAPFTERLAAGAALRSVGLWVAVVITMIISIFTIYYA